jgi:Niemann-Pick C1 protein
VDGINFYVTQNFGEALYQSCKDVKFGTMNTRAIDFVGGGANSYQGDSFIIQINKLHKLC